MRITHLCGYDYLLNSKCRINEYMKDKETTQDKQKKKKTTAQFS